MHGNRFSIDISLIITPENSIAGVKDISFQPVQAHFLCTLCGDSSSYQLLHFHPCLWPFGFRASINSIVHTLSVKLVVSRILQRPSSQDIGR